MYIVFIATPRVNLYHPLSKHGAEFAEYLIIIISHIYYPMCYDFVSILYPCGMCDCSTDNKFNSLTIISFVDLVSHFIDTH